jgi:hypothetical protein
MEFKASTLALDYMPVMIIDGHGKTPYYINPCDVGKLNPSCGDFCVEARSPSAAPRWRGIAAHPCSGDLCLHNSRIEHMPTGGRALPWL